MSKPVKAMLRKELVGRLKGVESLVVVSLTGVDGVSNNRLRRELGGRNIRLSVVKNSVARRALAEVGLSSAVELIDGPCALVTGGDSVVLVVRELFEQRKDIPNLSVRGALMEDEIFGPDRIEELRKYPTREEALANLSGQVAGPGAALAGALLGAGERLAGIVKAIQDRTQDAEDN